MTRLDPTRDTITLKNIDQLDPATLIANTDKLIVFQAGATRSATLSQVFGQFASNAQLTAFEASVTGQIANMVTTIGTQTLTGDKTFAGAIAVPAPSAASHAVPRIYVDDRDIQNVKLTGDQSIAGVKTFATPPILSVAPTDVNHAVRKGYVDTLDAQNVKLTGDQTIAGTKTFSSIPALPNTNPVASNEATRKGYVDNLDAGTVKLSGAQTISGIKTFTALPQSTAAPTALDQLTRKGYVDDRDALYMPLAGGTFTGLITVPVATLAGHPVRKDMFDTLGVRAANSYIQNAVANPRAVVTMTAVAHPSGTFSLAPSGSSGQEIEYVLPTIASTSVGHTLIFARWGVGASNFFVSAGGAANILDAQYLFATLSGNAARLVVVRLRNEWFVVSYSGGVTFTV